MKTNRFLLLLLAITVLLAVFYEWTDNYFVIVGATLSLIGVGFLVTVGGLIAISSFKKSFLFNDKELINEAIEVIIKKYKGNKPIIVKLKSGDKFYILHEKLIKKEGLSSDK